MERAHARIQMGPSERSGTDYPLEAIWPLQNFQDQPMESVVPYAY